MRRHGRLNTALLEASADWEVSADRLLRSQGWVTAKQGRQIGAWLPGRLKQCGTDLSYVEGALIGPIWLGGRHRNTAIRLAARRFYFSSGDLRGPLREREGELLADGAVPRPEKMAILAQIRAAFSVLAASTSFKAIPSDREADPINLLCRTTASGRTGREIPLAPDMWRGIQRAGVHSVPRQLSLYVVNDSFRPDGARQAEAYIQLLKQKWADIGGDPDGLKIGRIRLDRLVERLEATNATEAIEDCIFLIGVSGERGERLSLPQARALELLDQLGQPYRLFSYDNRQLRYSASNQVLSLLQGARGVPYRLKLPYPTKHDDGLLLGVDIGHDRDRRLSALVVAALDSTGVFLGAVKHRITLNEALHGEVVSRLLREARDLAEQNLGRTTDKAIVFRDGRIPMRRPLSGQEAIEDYVTALGVPTSFVEVRKGGNPPLWIEDGEDIYPAPSGSMLTPSGSSVRMLSCYESIDQAGPPRTFKVTVPQNGEAFGWGLDDYAALTCGLCYSPSLGVKPHLPGPIYWADGIGKTSDTDHRFGGQYVRIID